MLSEPARVRGCTPCMEVTHVCLCTSQLEMHHGSPIVWIQTGIFWRFCLWTLRLKKKKKTDHECFRVWRSLNHSGLNLSPTVCHSLSLTHTNTHSHTQTKTASVPFCLPPCVHPWCVCVFVCTPAMYAPNIMQVEDPNTYVNRLHLSLMKSKIYLFLVTYR